MFNAIISMRVINFLISFGGGMKRLFIIICLAVALVGVGAISQAVELKGRGYMSLSYEVATNSKFANSKRGENNPDDFSAGERVRLQLDAIASEALSGVVLFEIGDIYAGNAETGGALGADGVIVELKRAYIDWQVPHSELKFRMGIQGMKLPLFASKGNFVLDDDAAGIVASYKFNKNFALTGMWARLLNDSELKSGRPENIRYIHSGYSYDVTDPDNDSLDFFSALLPMKFDGIAVTPWVGYAAMGDGIGRNPSKDYSSTFVSTSRKKLQEGMGVYTGEGSVPTLLEYGGGQTNTWWGGFSLSLTKFDPFRFKFDFIYGNKVGNGSNSSKYFQKDNGGRGELAKGWFLDEDRYNRQGWYISGLAEYKMDHFTPGIFFWYSSGDDNDLSNGSERLPALSGNWEYTHTGFKATKASGNYDGLLAYSPLGMWGVALQIMDISFIEDLKNHIKVLYMRGTNSPSMPRKVAQSQYYNLGPDKVDGIEPVGRIGSYLTTNDWAMEIDFDTDYKIYENLHLVVEASYLHVGFDKDTWKWTGPNGVEYGRKWVQRPDNSDVFKVGLNFHYTF